MKIDKEIEDEFDKRQVSRYSRPAPHACLKTTLLLLFLLKHSDWCLRSSIATFAAAAAGSFPSLLVVSPLYFALDV